MTETTADEARARLEEMADPRILAVNQKHGDDYAVNLTKLRALAKELKHQPALAAQLWDSGDSAARLLAILVSRPKDFEAEQLDAMLRGARTPKVHDWLVSYIVAKSRHADELRERWMRDEDPVVQSAGWALTAQRVQKEPEGLDLPALLDRIAAEMKDAPERLQWGMNTCLAHIGIENPELRGRARGIGERLGVLKDYPTPPNCISPYAPTWIDEMVRRKEG